ncbi:translation initiation factor IF-5A [archaeon]|jgi:translation initiation factor 5A|nr:translation initiation factor IF-5A [archaeon]MBT3730765.1 translation initiation factor IF-5A [archaeon]MBT4669667.1 translation initiation factor IF-5A [archaeon]MBT5030424.1 translation initiation factor IF-5A [archaeon]MBT5288283.1 translation initiation factor IF-5A [archaeon]
MGEVKQIHATDAKPGRYVVFDGKACVVKNLDISRPGKHGHAKCRIEAVSLIDGKKTVKLMPGHDKLDSPIIGKKTAQILSVTGDKANVMDMETYETFDLEIPSELKEKVKEGVTVLYWIILEDKVMKEVRD